MPVPIPLQPFPHPPMGPEPLPTGPNVAGGRTIRASRRLDRGT